MLCAGCLSTTPARRAPVDPGGWASREDGADLRVEMTSSAPSFEVSVENRAAAPIRMAGANITVEDEAGRSFQVVTDAVEVAPGRRWRGDLMRLTKEPTALRPGRVGVVVRGVRVGDRELEPQAFVFEHHDAEACPTPR
jgi:hypothetical protein